MFKVNKTIFYYMASSASGQDESNPALWLATRAGKMEPSCPLGTTRLVPQEKFPRKPYNKSFIDQVCSVKMAWYWPRSFFACLWTSTPSRSINTQKKNSANIQPSWPHSWSITHTYGFCRPIIGLWAWHENNAPQLANHSACNIGYKHKSCNKCGLLTKHAVKMAGYWPSSFLLHVYGPRHSQGPNAHQKKDKASIKPGHARAKRP